MLRRPEYQSLLNHSEDDRETYQRVGFLRKPVSFHPVTSLLLHHPLQVCFHQITSLLRESSFLVVSERGPDNHQSRKKSQINREEKEKKKEEQSNFTKALSIVNEMPEDEKSKLFLTIFRDLSVTSKSALLLDLLQECKDLKAAGQVSFQNIFIIFKYFKVKIFYNNVQVTNSPVTELMRDNRAVEQSDIDMRYESNKKNIVQVQ